MNFASYDFWELLFCCLIASKLITEVSGAIRPAAKNTVSKLCLAATGLVLLGGESWLTLAVFLWVVGLSWTGVVIASRKGFRKDSLVSRLIFVILLGGQLAPLFYYKYWTFVLNDLFGLGVRQPSVLIPMGLSFYTFQKIGFWIDTIRNPESRPRFLDYLNFCSFFPQIVAGPIEKRQSLLPQIENIRFAIHREHLTSALQWIILGLSYKLIVADNIGNLSGKLQIHAANPWHVWFECFAFALRIYFDFAGYSFIAVGLGLIFGVRLTLNFRCPYWSKDLREFWRTWHVTLGAWLRDYVYVPLGGRRVKWWMLNTIIVFLVSGIWHGAGWGFLIWGLLHGVGVAVCGIRPGLLRFGPAQWAITLIYTVASWLFFFERNPAALKEKALAILQPGAYLGFSPASVQAAFPGPAAAMTFGLVTLVAAALLVLEGIGVRKNTEPYLYARYPAVSFLLVVLTVLLAPMEESQFIYFNF